MIENKKLRYTLLIVSSLVVAGIIYAVENSGHKSNIPTEPLNLPASERNLPSAADFAGATGWLNTPNNQSLDLVALRGKVVLLDFWTYSCINCIHTLPHVTKLYDTYRDHGLVVVGAHSPEFGFEKNRDNVANAIEQYSIHYPVAQDNDFGIWKAYHNNYWPAHYLIDQYGKIRETHFGEGGYADTELQVRDLLREAGYSNLPAPIEDGVETGGGSHTPELYAATGRSALANPEGYHAGQDIQYAAPATRSVDRIYVAGAWHDGADSLTARQDATVWVDFHGAAANLVAAGPDGACVEVRLDGAPIPAHLAGKDVIVGAQKSCVVLSGSKSYDLYAGPNQSHALELGVPAGFEIFTFAFTG